MKRSLRLTPELLRLYSRRGNFHSDTDAAAGLGYDQLIAQGMQAAGPAYGLLLDAWGHDFLDRGTLALKFVGMVTDGETVDATVEIADRNASITVTCGDRTAVVGTASRSGTEVR
jgi:acyl dehydratase